MKRPDRYLYPAVFTYEDGQEIAVTFPDLPGCVTCGKDDAEALAMAQDALGGHLWCMEDDNDVIPAPTPLRAVKTQSNEVVVPVGVYMPVIRLAQVNKAVSRTVTIPAWLNAAAIEKGVNFSQTLQVALMNVLNLHASTP